VELMRFVFEECHGLAVKGNHEGGVVAAKVAHGRLGLMVAAAIDKSWRWTAELLTMERIRQIDGLPLSIHAWLGRRRLVLTHGSPSSCNDYLIEPGIIAQELQRLPPGTLLLGGHTHWPGVWSIEGHRVSVGHGEVMLPVGETYLVNPGSVGQPRDSDPRAAFAVLEDTQKGTLVRFRRVEYDVEAAATGILRVGLPEPFAARLRRGT
jgi:diadenosine tetraphosphatase ApaH/serine/threonine PP2A family protein phosphatase